MRCVASSREASDTDCAAAAIPLARSSDQILLVPPERVRPLGVQRALSADDLVGATVLPERPDHVDQDGVAGRGVEDRQQRLVVVEEIDHAALADRRHHQVVLGLHPLAVVGGDPLGAQPRSLALQQPAHVVDVHELLERQPLHDGPLVGLPLGQARLLEATDRLAYGHDAGSHLLGEVSDPQAGAGGQLAADDRLVEDRVDLVRQQRRLQSSEGSQIKDIDQSLQLRVADL